MQVYSLMMDCQPIQDHKAFDYLLIAYQHKFQLISNPKVHIFVLLNYYLAHYIISIANLIKLVQQLEYFHPLNLNHKIFPQLMNFHFLYELHLHLQIYHQHYHTQLFDYRQQELQMLDFDLQCLPHYLQVQMEQEHPDLIHQEKNSLNQLQKMKKMAMRKVQNHLLDYLKMNYLSPNYLQQSVYHLNFHQHLVMLIQYLYLHLTHSMLLNLQHLFVKYLE